jgi:hypothetical protein
MSGWMNSKRDHTHAVEVGVCMGGRRKGPHAYGEQYLGFFGLQGKETQLIGIYFSLAKSWKCDVWLGFNIKAIRLA